jgi:hypothetical protein
MKMKIQTLMFVQKLQRKIHVVQLDAMELEILDILIRKLIEGIYFIKKHKNKNVT